MGLYDIPIQMHYTDLDPAADYKVRVVYGSGPIRLVADETIEIHPLLRKVNEVLEFDISSEATKDGELTLSWTKTAREGRGGFENQVCEVWLIRKSSANLLKSE